MGPTQTLFLSLSVLNQDTSKADHSSPFSVDIRNIWLYTSTTPCAFMARCLITYKKKFTFTHISTKLPINLRHIFTSVQCPELSPNKTLWKWLNQTAADSLDIN
jgi:hypothetical protein